MLNSLSSLPISNEHLSVEFRTHRTSAYLGLHAQQILLYNRHNEGYFGVNSLFYSSKSSQNFHLYTFLAWISQAKQQRALHDS